MQALQYLLSKFLSLPTKGKTIAIAVAVAALLCGGLLVWWLGAKIGGAIVAALTGTGGYYTQKQVKQMQADSDQVEDRKQQIRKDARKQNATSLRLQEQQATAIDAKIRQQHEKADQAAVNQSDEDLVNQALKNADRINKTGTTLLLFLLPFFGLGLMGCQMAGAAGAATPGSSNTTPAQYMKVKRIDFLKIVKSQQTCLGNLAKAKVACKGKLDRQRNTLQGELDACKVGKKLKSRQLIECQASRNPSTWLPWTLFGVAVGAAVLFGILYGQEKYNQTGAVQP